jgi:hypothetical protein
MSGWVVTSLILLPIILGIAVIVVLWKRKASGIIAGEVNYRAFFIIGIIILPIGVSWMVIALFTDLFMVVGLPFFTLGLVYIAIGLNNRDKWNK